MGGRLLLLLRSSRPVGLVSFCGLQDGVREGRTYEDHDCEFWWFQLVVILLLAHSVVVVVKHQPYSMLSYRRTAVVTTVANGSFSRTRRDRAGRDITGTLKERGVVPRLTVEMVWIMGSRSISFRVRLT